MAQDYRRGAAKPSPRRTRPRSCVWSFLLGAMLGGFGVGLYWMRHAPQQALPPVAAIPRAERPAPPQPSFQFPNILQEAEVDISDKGKPPPPPAPRPEPPPPKPANTVAEPPKTEAAAAAPAASPGSYVLQVASFKTAKDAESMKAQLALLGVSTRIQSVTIRDGQVWHRVVTAPLNSKKAMEETRATLKKHGKDAMPIKVK
jgi:cell division protein FtsN